MDSFIISNAIAIDEGSLFSLVSKPIYEVISLPLVKERFLHMKNSKDTMMMGRRGESSSVVFWKHKTSQCPIKVEDLVSASLLIISLSY